MKNKPLFSILIANYNNGKYLHECLESVFAQTYKKWEVVIVDDCSTDDFSEVIYQKYKDNPKFKIFHNKKNQGCGFTKRACISNASGELCAFLDPDDTITADACEQLVTQHSKNIHHSLIYSTHYICDADLKITEVSPHVGEIPKNESQLTFKGPKISHFAVFKRNLYDKTEGIDPNLTTSVDQDLYFKLEEVGPIKFVDLPLYYYRHHSKSISLNKNSTKAFYTNVLASHSAYKRRRSQKLNIKNLSFFEMSRRLYSYHIWIAGQHLNNKDFNKFGGSWANALKYFYWDKNFYIPRLLFRFIKVSMLQKE